MAIRLCSILLTVMLLTMVNCQSTSPRLPLVDGNKSLAERSQQYEDNRIIDDVAIFQKPYLVDDKRYQGSELAPLFQASYTSPKARAFYNSASNYELWATVFGAIGGGLIGFNLGRSFNNVATYPEIYYAGAGSLVVGIFLSAISSSKLASAIKEYNLGLKAAILPELGSSGNIYLRQQYAIHYNF